MENLVTCPFCNGDGEIIVFYETETPYYFICLHCNGDGEVTKDYLNPKSNN